MRVFWLPMHVTMDTTFPKAVQNMGFECLLPDASFKPLIKYGQKFSGSTDFWTAVSIEKLQENPPDLIVVSCCEVEVDVYDNIVPLFPKAKLVHYAGNNTVPYNKDKVKYIFTTDSLLFAIWEGVERLHYFPWVDYESFEFKKNQSGNILGSYIVSFRTTWEQSVKLYDDLNIACPELEFKLYETAPHNTIAELMDESIATLHIKEAEGYGYAIVESLAKGRPVILYEPFAKNKIYNNWCIDNESALFFSDTSEFRDKVVRLITDNSYRERLQNGAARIIREKINNEEQTANLKKLFIRAAND